MFTITLSHSSSTNKRFAHHCLSHIRSPFLIHAAFRVLCRIIALSSVLQLQLYMFRVCPVLYTYSTVQYVCASRFFSLLIFHVSFHLICNEISRRVVFICNCLLCPYIMSSEWKKKNNVCFFFIFVFSKESTANASQPQWKRISFIQIIHTNWTSPYTPTCAVYNRHFVISLFIDEKKYT